MSDKTKRIFLAICIIVPFVVYCVVYYSSMIKNAPFRFSDFESIELTYGTTDSLLNSFDSKSGDYQYLTNDNKLVKDTLKMRDDDLLYLHRKAQELGFWNVDDDMTTKRDAANPGSSIPRYILKFTYKDKSKEVVLDADYEGNPKMKDAAKSTIDHVMTMLAEVKAR